jgi:1-phosphofructokinase family hexose kinase
MSKSTPRSRRAEGTLFCISLNPAIDTRLVIDNFAVGRVNRVREVHREPGGKGAHVAMALKALGASPVWIGFSGGVTGTELLTGLERLKIATRPVLSKKPTRVNLEIQDAHGQVTEILEPGGMIARKEWLHFRAISSAAFKRGPGDKIVIISGSQPPGIPAEAIGTLVELAHKGHCVALVDSSGLPLAKALAARPDFVKINREEAEFVTQITVSDALSAAKAARRLLRLGALSAAVSLGERGIVGVRGADSSAIYAWTAPLQTTSTVGSGDSALAGFAFAVAQDRSFEQALALAVACGAANCLAPLPARIARTDVSRIEKTVQIERLPEKGDV